MQGTKLGIKFKFLLRPPKEDLKTWKSSTDKKTKQNETKKQPLRTLGECRGKSGKDLQVWRAGVEDTLQVFNSRGVAEQETRAGIREVVRELCYVREECEEIPNGSPENQSEVLRKRFCLDLSGKNIWIVRIKQAQEIKQVTYKGTQNRFVSVSCLWNVRSLWPSKHILLSCWYEIKWLFSGAKQHS